MRYYNSDPPVVWSFTPDSEELLVGLGNALSRHPLPTPVKGDPKRLELWIQTITGMELDEYGTPRWLDADTLRNRRQELQKLGGPPK